MDDGCSLSKESLGELYNLGALTYISTHGSVYTYEA